MSWPMVKLGEICRLEYGKNLPSADRISGDYEVFGSNGPVGTHTSAFTNGKTVVIGRKGSIGEAAFSARPCWPIDTTYYVDEAGTEQDLRWLYYLISSLNLRRFNKATGVPSLNRTDAYDCEIPLPPLEEQKRIAGILDQADALRRLRARALEKLNTFGQALFRSISQSVTDNAKIEDVSEVNPKRRFVDGENFEVSFLPMSSVSELGEIISYDVRMLEDVRKGFTYFERGDILIAKITPCFENGKGCLYFLDREVGFGSTEYHVVRPHKPDLAHWLHFATRSDAFRTAGERAMTGSAGQKRVPAQFVKSYTIPIPDEDKVRYFNENIERIRSIIQQAEVSFSMQDALFASLQSAAFQGRL